MQIDRGSFIVFLLLALFIIAPANALNLGVHSDVGSVTKEIVAGDQTSYSGKTVVGQEAILDSWDASGPDEKSIKIRVSSGSNAQEISVENSGPMSASVTSTASLDAVISCLDGEMGGDTALLKLASESKGNDQYLTAGFSGEVSEDSEGLDASLTLVAAGSSGIDGDLSLLGVDGLGEGVQGDTSMALNGLYVKPDGSGLGQFGAALVNVDKMPGGKVYEANVVSGTYDNYNDPAAWVAAGWRWQNIPNIQFYLRSDKNLANEKLTSTQAKVAISAAAESWDAVTTPELFKNSIIVSSTAAADKYDGKNVHAWNYISGGALAYSRTRYYTSLYEYGPDGTRYNKAIESDICYNTAYSWTTNPANSALYPKTNTFYLQTVAEHEMGHTLGLGDTYLHDLYKYDLAQMMGYYNDINDISGNDREVDLGEGDINGIKTLYG